MDRGYDVELMPRDMPFEGAGDALFDCAATNRLWMAHGHRSVLGGEARYSTSALDTEVVALKPADTQLLPPRHLLLPARRRLPRSTTRPASDAASRATIEKRVPAAAKRIAIGEEDALAFACNAVNVDTTLVVNRCDAGVRAGARRGKGFDSRADAASEFMKAGGSAKCLDAAPGRARTGRSDGSMSSDVAWSSPALRAAPRSAQVYKWVDEEGRTHYGEEPPAWRMKATKVADPQRRARDGRHP